MLKVTRPGAHVPRMPEPVVARSDSDQVIATALTFRTILVSVIVEKCKCAGGAQAWR
jgi:hypothetical protein